MSKYICHMVGDINNLLYKPAANGVPKERLVQWERPPEGFFELNFDECFGRSWDDGSWVVWFLWLYWEDNKLSCLTLCFAKGVGYMLGEGN